MLKRRVNENPSPVHTKRVFLQRADGFAADHDTLMRVAELLREHVPSVICCAYRRQSSSLNALGD